MNLSFFFNRKTTGMPKSSFSAISYIHTSSTRKRNPLQEAEEKEAKEPFGWSVIVHRLKLERWPPAKRGMCPLSWRQPDEKYGCEATVTWRMDLNARILRLAGLRPNYSFNAFPPFAKEERNTKNIYTSGEMVCGFYRVTHSLKMFCLQKGI